MPTDPILVHTKRVAFELSNICNMGYAHPQCPASLVKPEDRRVLPSAVVYTVLDSLGAMEFKGYVAFYGYSEPLVDPRLVSMIQYATRACPGCKPSVTTNGFMLTQTMLDDLAAAGLCHARVSAYGTQEYKRLCGLKPPFAEFKVRLRGGTAWKHRIDDYDREPNPHKAPCFCPLIDIQINCKGQIRICCADYQNRHIFGDLATETFEAILRSGKMQAVYSELTKGIRKAHLCRRCGIQRHWKGV